MVTGYSIITPDIVLLPGEQGEVVSRLEGGGGVDHLRVVQGLVDKGDDVRPVLEIHRHLDHVDAHGQHVSL